MTRSFKQSTCVEELSTGSLRGLNNDNDGDSCSNIIILYMTEIHNEFL